MPPDYSKGKIYIIRSPNTPSVYIGSTVSKLHKRFSQHKHPSNKLTSKNIIDSGDAYIELLEDYPCENRNQLHKREGQLMRATEGCINRYVAGRTTQEKKAEDRLAITQMVIRRYENFIKAGVPRQKAYIDAMYEASSRDVLDRYIASLVSA